MGREVKMSLRYIREQYGVPAKRGGRVKFKGKPGTITGFHNAYLRIRLDGERVSGVYHPTWEIEYEKEATDGQETQIR
jgi:hypothetical protein